MRFNTPAMARVIRDDQVLKNQQHSNLPSKRQTNNDNTCLPPKLVSAASGCATSCLEGFVRESFGNPSCEDASDLTFLCRAISLSGYTIGEGGLQCLLQSCGTTESVTPQVAGDVYNICRGITGAQPKTQPTVTVTVSPSSTASNPLGTDIQIATVTPSTGSLIATDTAVPPNLGSFGYVTASAPFPAPTTPAPAATSRSGPGQTAGIAVGSAAGAFSLLGLMFFFCRRRKKQNARRKTRSPRQLAQLTSVPSSTSTSRTTSPGPKAEDVLPQHAVNPSPIETIAAAVEAASAGVSASALVAAGITAKTQKTRSYWRKSINPEEIGVAVTPKEENDGFRKSQGDSLRPNTKSMIPIPESAVLPTAYSSITTIDTKLGQTGGRGSFANAAAAAVAAATATAGFRHARGMPAQQYTDVAQSTINEKDVDSGDLESQDGSRPVTQHSLLASARASLSELGSMLKRSMSLKRQPSDAKPLLKPTVYSEKSVQPVNRYPLTPKYDNGNFEPNDSLASTTTSPEPFQAAPTQGFAVPRKPTFSSFVAGKLLHTTAFKSPPPATSQEPMPAMPAILQGRGLSANSGPATTGVAEAPLPEMALAAPRGMSDVRSPAMMPAPLTIRKSPSSRTVRTQTSTSTPGKDMTITPQPPLPTVLGQLNSIYQTPSKAPTRSKAREIMGLGSPINAHKYARKPLPIPSHPPNQFATLAPITEPNRLSAVDTLAAVKANQQEQADMGVEDLDDSDVPLSAATSWLSVPVSTQPNTTRVTMVRSPPTHEQQVNSYQSLESASPRGKPAFPSMAPSLNSIYTKYQYSESPLPAIVPTSAITLTAATYRPTTQHSPSVPPVPKLSSQVPPAQESSFTSAPRTERDQSLHELESPDQFVSDLQSNISSPPRFTKTMNPYNPYFPRSPARQKSTSSSRSQSVALSSHPTSGVPQLAYPDPPSSMDLNNLQQSNGAYFRTPSLRPTTSGRNGFRQPSSILSPDSADPRRESDGFPKVVFTPNKLPGGDLVLTVDTTGKGYGGA